MSVISIETETLGEGWLALSRAILEHGEEASYDGDPTRELPLTALTVRRPRSDDPLIAELGDPVRLAWMRENFLVARDVPELGDAESYAVRLFDYGRAGLDQIAWVVDRLRSDPECRSASITTFQPLTDTAYVPCVSLLDFWLRARGLELVVYAHSLDFGKKAYGNLVELARLEEYVAGRLDAPIGPLVLLAKSAHIYRPELELMRDLTTRPVAVAAGRRG